MSDDKRPIAVGDMVMIVRPMPCGHGAIGKPFIVAELARVGFCICKYCNKQYDGIKLAAMFQKGVPVGVDVGRLQRIDPPSKETTTEQEKELTT